VLTGEPSIVMPGEMTPGRDVDRCRQVGGNDPHPRAGRLGANLPIYEHEEFAAGQIAALYEQHAAMSLLIHGGDLI
jgi:hypothetical protein